MPAGGGAFHTLREIAERFGGEIIGDAAVEIRRVATLANAGPDAIAFLANERYLSQLEGSRAGAVIVGEPQRNATARTRIVCSNPYAYFARVSALLNPEPPRAPGVHPSAAVDPAAALGPGVQVGPQAVVEAGAAIGANSCIGPGSCIGAGAVIGSDTRLMANVTVYHGCVVGDRVLLHSGVVIGADGFGIAMDEGRWIKVPQIGRVVIGNDVEIGANTTVDRGAIEDTVIEDGVKLDNQIQVGHNVRIGAHTAIAGCAGIAGSTRIGRRCRIGGGSCIAGHLTIADDVEISAFTFVSKSITAAGTYTGAYLFEPHAKWLRNAVQLRHLAEIAARVKKLEGRVPARKRSKP